jgi:NhaP-type Na+/H+ or K+/H+ antiporter
MSAVAAAALVAYHLAVGAVVAGSFALWEAGLRIVVGAVGGVAIGLLTGSRQSGARSRCRAHPGRARR